MYTTIIQLKNEKKKFFFLEQLVLYRKFFCVLKLTPIRSCGSRDSVTKSWVVFRSPGVVGGVAVGEVVLRLQVRSMML